MIRGALLGHRVAFRHHAVLPKGNIRQVPPVGHQGRWLQGSFDAVLTVLASNGIGFELFQPMIRAGSILLLAVTLTGCAQSPPVVTEPSSITSTRFPEDSGARPVAASALAFDPPVTLAEAPLYLGREGRGLSAFFGYEEGFTEYYRLYTDDRQIGYGGPTYGSGYYGYGGWGGWYDRYERRATSVKTGVIRR